MKSMKRMMQETYREQADLCSWDKADLVREVQNLRMKLDAAGPKGAEDVIDAALQIVNDEDVQAERGCFGTDGEWCCAVPKSSIRALREALEKAGYPADPADEDDDAEADEVEEEEGG